LVQKTPRKRCFVNLGRFRAKPSKVWTQTLEGLETDLGGAKNKPFKVKKSTLEYRSLSDLKLNISD
jgi:hypothetical protein